jgi:hypothetical protein
MTGAVDSLQIKPSRQWLVKLSDEYIARRVPVKWQDIFESLRPTPLWFWEV